jgi:hypothetical protein
MAGRGHVGNKSRLASVDAEGAVSRVDLPLAMHSDLQVVVIPEVYQMHRSGRTFLELRGQTSDLYPEHD